MLSILGYKLFYSFKRLSMFTCVITLVLFIVQFAFAETHIVKTADDLRKWAKDAQPGDIIIVSAETYNNWGTFTFTANGTAEKPIIYKANSQGDVTFTGDLFFEIEAQYLIFQNLDFNTVGSGYSPYSVFRIENSNNRITYCRFYNSGDSGNGYAANVRFIKGGHDCEVDHCLFDDPQAYAIGSYVVDGQDYPKNNHIHHNVFQNFDVGYTAYQTASGSTNNYGTEDTANIFEYNTLQNWTISESESISVKSSGNIIRYNTFKNMPNAYVSLRKATNCEIYGNTFYKTKRGINIFGTGHKIYNNIFAGDIGIALMWGNTREYILGWPSWLAASDCTIAYNTFVTGYTANDAIIDIAYSGFLPKEPVPTIKPKGNKIYNNIFYRDHDNMIPLLGSEESANTVDNNLFYAVDGVSITGILGTNYIIADPLLTGTEVNSRLTENSPAIDKAFDIPDFEITKDLDGNSRPQGVKNDIGASEFIDSLLAPKDLKIIQ